MDILATRLTVIRHGETAWNTQRRIQGHTDIALNAQGLQQAQRLAGALAAEDIQAVYSSDLQRALHTAQMLAAPHQCPVHTTPLLRERCFGHIEGHTFADFEQHHPQDAWQWRKRDPHWQPPGDGGESLLMLRQRIEQVVQDIAARHTGGHIVLVAHGGVLDVLYRAATRLDLQAARTWQLPNCAINRLLWTPGGLTLVGWGDTAHLDGMPGAALHDSSVQ